MCLRICIIHLILLFLTGSGYSQPLMTKNGFAGFYSKTPFEDIRAENNQVYAIIDPTTRHIAFALLMKGFIFSKELMQVHFNENYIESDKYPKATFSGDCSGEMDLTKEGIYQVVIKGVLMLHGVSQPLETTAQLEVKNDQIAGTAFFNVKPEDFQIRIPGVVRDKIAREIKVRIHTNWTRLK